MTDPFLNRELTRFSEERELLQNFPVEDLAVIIREVGFSCTGCGNCCMTAQNGHVFLLDQDTRRAKEICPDAIIPAPFFEICDKKGNFYVSGYALRTTMEGLCVHLIDGRCRIYNERFSICRVYPYMLHREPDEKGIMTFRQISGLNEHGEYNTYISDSESIALAQVTKSYEKEWLTQMIGFYQSLIDLFAKSGERHVRKIYDQQMREFAKGETVNVFVFFEGEFIRHTVCLQDYGGIIQIKK
ncbi:MAG TPA: YkgJ family cysteine cluster protein [Methanospirillum sp.]|uniref:YkgJ family cysteine cluster protein n=1 Tax=Methanospirillum sp. TaxID=45200 RepID=UPI002C6CD841|nr:YkgJ family cysteine cluster protein [Methanospirillum sp.]HWQ65134.1 YkgJ family cysteine cluster protein [Methanospirillum sp.]